MTEAQPLFTKQQIHEAISSVDRTLDEVLTLVGGHPDCLIVAIAQVRGKASCSCHVKAHFLITQTEGSGTDGSPHFHAIMEESAATALFAMRELVSRWNKLSFESMRAMVGGANVCKDPIDLDSGKADIQLFSIPGMPGGAPN